MSDSRNIEKRRRVMDRSIKLGHCICDPKLSCPCDLLREKNVCLCAGERMETTAGPVRLTQLVEKTGCSSKIDQATLRRVLGGLPMPEDPRVIIGAPAGDDAGVFRIDDETGTTGTPTGSPTALVQTVDVFSPCVDDPYLFGQIAAANSVSDVYAMGGRPLTALSIIGFPARELPDTIMREILRGGVDKMAEAGVAIIGGHSINDGEIKAGFAVTGLIDPSCIMSNAAVKPGDALVMTKPIGTGILSFAAQIDRAPAGAVEAIGASMATLNKTAAEAMPRFDAHACTDITGFGLIGHLSAMAAASGVDVEIIWDDVPLFDGVLECVAAGIVPGGIERNRESSQDAVDTQEGVTPAMLDVLFDPQTSGGLLIALPSQRAQALVEYLRQRGVTAAAIVGRVLGVGAGRVVVKTDHKRSVPVGDEAMRRDEPCGSREERSAMSECCSHGHDEASGAAPPAPSGATGHGASDGSSASPACCATSGSSASAVPPDAQKKFHEFLQAVNAPGALDAHTKQAISLALAVLAKCDPCVRAHIAKARAKGFSASEIDEAAWLAISFGGAPLMMFYNAIRKELLG